MPKIDYRHAGAAELADLLDSATGLSTDDLRAALANALERIASLESDRNGLEQWLKAFNEHVDAVMQHGHGLLRQP